MIIFTVFSSYANVDNPYQRSVDYTLSPADNPLKGERHIPSSADKARQQNVASTIGRPIIPANYGEFVDESLATMTSSKGTETYVAKQELNLLAKLVRCDDQDDCNNRNKQFKINLFETAGIDINISSNLDK